MLDSFMHELSKIITMPSSISVAQIAVALLLSLVLGLVLSFIYIKTFEGKFYSQTFVQTLVIVCVVITLIIFVIGTNIARAFSLAGALSIIRFRSSIRDPRDVAFIFFAMGIGLACGSEYYLPAILFVVVLGLAVLLFKVTNFGHKKQVRKVLRVSLPEDMAHDGVFDDIFEKYVAQSKLIGVRTTNLGTLYELSYSILLKDGAQEKQIMDEIRERNGNLNIAILLEEEPKD